MFHGRVSAWIFLSDSRFFFFDLSLDPEIDDFIDTGAGDLLLWSLID